VLAIGSPTLHSMASKESVAAVSVSNLVNFSNLERVFGEIFESISKVNQRIDRLESDAASNVALSRFLALKNEYESSSTLFEDRIKYLEQMVSDLKPTKEQTAYNAESIEKLRERSKSFVDTESFESSLSDLELTISDKIEQIASTKCSNARTKKLEESTQGICAQISAMESLLQCKVDKSQVPLIECCQRQLDSLEKFRDQISQRVCIVDDHIADITTDLEQKLEKSLFNDSLLEIEQKITKKVDMSFLNEQVIKRLNTLLPDLLVLLKEHKQVSPSQCLNEIQTIRGVMENMTEALAVNKGHIEGILKSLYNVPSIQQMEIKADKAFCKNLNEESKTFCIEKCRTLESNIEEIHEAIDKLKVVSNSLTEKTKVALRFVDWYSSLQLES